MKILYVITKSNYGGAQRYVHEVATAFHNSGNEVAVACGGSGALAEKLREAGVSVFNVPSFERDIRIHKELRSFSELSGIIQAFDPDIVHLNSSKAGGIGAYAARLYGSNKIIFTAHGWPFLEKRNTAWRILAWIASWMTVLPSHSTILVSKNDLKHTRMPLAAKKCSVIRTSVPKIQFEKKQTARDILFQEKEQQKHVEDVWLATTAELTQNKNLFLAIDAVCEHNRQSDKKIFYSILGDGEQKEELLTYIKKNGAEEQIVLLGYVHDARNLLKAFDIFLLPSLKEGMPYALLEAGAAGLPCVASNVGGIPEIIEHEKHGLLINPHDALEITRALQALIENSEKRSCYAQRLQEKIERDFNLETMIKKTKEIYQR